MRKSLFVYVGICGMTGLLIGCQGNNVTNHSETRVFAENRTYVHSLVKSQIECDRLRESNPFSNCYQLLEFITDGTASILLSDIMSRGTYHIRDNQLSISTSGGDAPKTMVFTLSSDQQQLTSSDGTVWTRQSDCRAPNCLH